MVPPQEGVRCAKALAWRGRRRRHARGGRFPGGTDGRSRLAADEAAAGSPAERGKAPGLDQQDRDDGGAVAEPGGDAGRDPAAARRVGHERQRLAVALQDDRQGRDEQCAGQGAARRADAADDDHGEVLDRQQHAERLGDDVAEGERQQDAAEPGEHRGHQEGGALEPGDVHAHHRGGDLAVAHRVHRPPRPAGAHIAVEEPGERDGAEADVPELLHPGEGHAEDVEGLTRHVVEGEPGHGERRDVAAVEPARDGLGVDQHVLAEEDQPQRRHAQVDAPEAGGDGAEQHPGQPRGRPRPARRPAIGGRSQPIWSLPPAGCDGDAKKVYP